MLYSLLLSFLPSAVAQNKSCAELIEKREAASYDPIRIAESKGIDTSEIKLTFGTWRYFPSGFLYGEKVGEMVVDVSYRSKPVGRYVVNLEVQPDKSPRANIHSIDAFEFDSQSLKGKGLASLIYLSIARQLYKTHRKDLQIQSAEMATDDALALWSRMSVAKLAKSISPTQYQLSRNKIMSDLFLPLEKFLPRE